MTLFYDRAQISGRARITPEGYFVADALVAKANNIQTYRAGELGDAFADRDPNSLVRVFRPESAVFAVDSLKSASRLPITLDHPVKDGRAVMVDASNWREFAKGESGEEILRDGEFLRVPIRVTDAGAVSSVQQDRQEFSMGYGAEIVVKDGTFNGEAYDAELANIRYNHLAACRTARGGPELRITDERPASRQTEGITTMPNLVMIDGLPVDVANPEAAGKAIANLIAARDTATAALDASQEQVAAHATTIAARDAEIVGLKDQVAEAKLSPQDLRDAAASYTRTVNQAKALGATVTDEMDEAAVKAAAVAHKMGDAAKGYTLEQNATAFDVLAAQVGDAKPNLSDANADPLRAALRDGQPANLADGQQAFQDARAARFDRFHGAHRGAAATAKQEG